MRNGFLFMVLVIILILSCREFVGGQRILFGNLYDSDCSKPLADTKVVFIDANLSDIDHPTNVFRLDSMYTDAQGRFEFVSRPSDKVHDLGFVIYGQHSTIFYAIPLPASDYQGFEICELQ